MHTATLFNDGKGQAVRLPDAESVDFDPPPLKSPMHRPAEFPDVSD